MYYLESDLTSPFHTVNWSTFWDITDSYHKLDDKHSDTCVYVLQVKQSWHSEQVRLSIKEMALGYVCRLFGENYSR